ncbi:MAG: exodeoxyribonuclease VII small subunit [Rhodothermia bacterium]
MEQATAEEPSLERSIQRLEQIVLELEQGEQELETALESYEEGIKLARRCLEQLKTAELRIEELSSP